MTHTKSDIAAAEVVLPRLRPTDGEPFYSDHDREIFIMGIKYRDANPRPEVMELVDMLLRSLEIRDFDVPEDKEVMQLGLRIGFGALLDSAVKCWADHAEKIGLPGSQFTVGHCHATVVNALKAYEDSVEGE